MRNWNLVMFLYLEARSNTSLYRTYEELKRFQAFQIGNQKAKFVSYLWGIETARSDGVSTGRQVCIVPMRNWNIVILSTWYFFGRASLYRTYEELKRRWDRNPRLAVLAFVSYLWGIESHADVLEYNPLSATRLYRTYEELKPLTEWRINMTDICLYRTYEELKPDQRGYIDPGMVVCIVPMRNWNFEIAVKSAIFYCGLYRTYEELKPCTPTPMSIASRTFVSYLWAIPVVN